MLPSKDSTEQNTSPPANQRERWLWGIIFVQFILLLWGANQAGLLPSLPSSPLGLGGIEGQTQTASLWIIFLTGLTAGGLSCLAVQGGLLATTVARREQLLLQEEQEQESQRTGQATPILLFLAAKLVAYTLLGALLGLFGSWISLSTTMRGWLQIIIGLFMVGMALQMLDVHPIFRYLVIQPPKGIQRFVRKSSKGDDAFTPLFLGTLTVFIPCGVTQAMALLALGSGSATWGALIMSAFVLGTFPIFFLLGLATARLSSAWEGTFMQVAAIAIVFMALYSMIGGFRLLGYQIGLDGFNNPIEMADSETPLIDATPIPVLPAEVTGLVGATSDLPSIGSDGYQQITIAAMNEGYQPQQLLLRAGVPARVNLVTNETYSCARAFVIPALGVEKFLPETGTETIEFTPEAPGSIPFTCSMGMYTGVIEVVANDAQAPEVAQAPEAPEVAGAAPMATQANEEAFEQVGPPGYQEVTIAAMNEGYQPQLVKLRAGVPARINLVTNETYSCARAFVIPALGVEKILPETGTETIEFTPEAPGSIPFTCSMGMYTGVIEVVANEIESAEAPEGVAAPMATQVTQMDDEQMTDEMTDEMTHDAPDPAEESQHKEHGRILLTASEQDQMQVFIMNSDGTGLEKLTDGPNENIYPALSPDGAWVAYTSRHENNLDINLISIESRESKPLTHDPSRDYQPIFSPDGQQIAFISDRHGDADIWLMNRDGSEQRVLLSLPNDQHLGAWSPDGQSLLFVDYNPEQKRFAIWKMQLADGSLIKLTDLGNVNDGPVFSPDGERIAFYSDRTGSFNIFTMAADGSDIKQLTHSEQPLIMPVYSPNGQALIYGGLQGEGVLMSPAIGGEAMPLMQEIQALPTGWVTVSSP